VQQRIPWEAKEVAGKLKDVARARYDADEDLRVILAHHIQSIGEDAGRVSHRTRGLR